MGYKLAMYDIRGIQNYIFRTPELKSALGASALVEDIIHKALDKAIEKYREAGHEISADLDWCSVNEGPNEYKEDTYDVQVLYIGGGNAFVTFKDDLDLVKSIHKSMSKYIIEMTYSLQLAIALVEKTQDYAADQRNIRLEMEKVKQQMSIAAPLGALPIFKTDAKTGYPIVDMNGLKTSESILKHKAAEEKREYYSVEEKLIDSLRTKKGIDSNVAVIHIDGNNLGLRIQSLMNDKKTYQEGVTAARTLSYQIDSSFKKVFRQMDKYIKENAVLSKDLNIKDNNIYVIPVVTAGDDITYVCNGRIALESVSYFAKAISGLSMSVDSDPNVREKYSFSICAGIAFVNSHFPFHVAYDVAEECCENAKAIAKKEDNLENGMIGNWVDFHVCKNIQARHLKELRNKEYVTCLGEHLLVRPYYIPTGREKEGSLFASLAKSDNSLIELKKNVRYFNNAENIPISFAKQLRNVYPLGEYEVKELTSFLESRGKKMPDGSYEMYHIKNQGKKSQIKHAIWYDSLEIMDLYAELKGED